MAQLQCRYQTQLALLVPASSALDPRVRGVLATAQAALVVAAMAAAVS